LVSLLSARAAGAEPIVITDLFENRLHFAKKMIPGVRTVLIKQETTPKERADLVKAAAGGPVKLVLECTGVESSVHTGIYVRIDYFSAFALLLTSANQSTMFGGKVFIIGVGKNEQVVCLLSNSAKITKTDGGWFASSHSCT
jgi:L-iditol 2-dehydrogenase